MNLFRSIARPPLFAGGTTAVAIILAGCSDEPAAAPQPSATVAAVPAAQPAPSTALKTPGKIVRPALPDDVFFENPLAIAAVEERIAGAPAAMETAVATATPGNSLPPADALATETNWDAYISAEILAEEVRRIRERLASRIDSVANFNNSYLELPPYIAALAAFAEVAARHSGEVSWKENAKHVRELAAEMAVDQLSRGEKSFQQVAQPFAKITATLDGKPPAELPEADDRGDFALAADFGGLMKRIGIGQNLLSNAGAGEALFKQNAADLNREAHVLAALAQVIGSDDYGYGDDPAFQKHVKAMTQASLEIGQAAEAGDYSKFDLAQSALMQSCTQCHSEYRN